MGIKNPTFFAGIYRALSFAYGIVSDVPGLLVDEPSGPPANTSTQTLSVAFGQIPQLVAPKAQSFGIRVVTYDPYVSKEVAERAGVEQVTFDELLKISDYISIHTPLLPATRHLFNAEVLSRMKPTAYLINTARGPIIDEAALASALDQGHLAGAALDVMEQEPPSGSPLFGRDNVIVTPHTSFYSEESLVDLQTKAAEEVVRVLSGQTPKNPVNPEALKAAQSI